MALVNVGMQLAREGRRVLLVDMDLEAPGLHTYEHLKPVAAAKGVVDFIADYWRTGIAPVVSDYVYTPSIKDMRGTISVMPTGLQDEKYGMRLNSLDWPTLYRERDGYLLFEDLKAQWEATYAPDYVLIDSRTGHTDISGICTRQLPDTVVVLFFPNDQNLHGLETIVSQIRSDETRLASPPVLHFVASNVPDLDDEDHILSDRYKLFRQALKYDRLIATIRHYDSLALLNQAVFTIDRPNSKLAREYKNLAHQLIRGNYDDRVGVVQTLEELGKGNIAILGNNSRAIDTALKSIEPRYREDGEVIYRLAIANRLLGREPAAQRLMAESEKLGFETEETLLLRASAAYQAGDIEVARQHLRKTFGKQRERMFSLESVVRLVAERDLEYLLVFVQFLIDNDIDADDCSSLALELMNSLPEVAAAEKLLSYSLSKIELGNVSLLEGVVNQLSLCLISEGEFARALSLMSNTALGPVDEDMATIFNTAIARWGEIGSIPRDLFLRIVNMHPTEFDGRVTPNRLQCLALSYWAIGKPEPALELVRRARKSSEKIVREFSAWRYLSVDRDEFVLDLDSLESAIETGQGIPAVIARNQKSS
jgi:MinD-like ATPase involved in chromosome partitioning or flagellar assembly